MPIPFIIGGAAIAAGLFGAKKGYDAKNNYAQAKNVVESAIEEFEEKKDRLEFKKKKPLTTLWS